MGLAEIKKRVNKCKKCDLYKTKTNYVPGEGSSKAGIMFIGEGPGRMEDLTGKPFVGRAGKLLDNLLEKIKIKRKDVFITSCLKCRTPNNRIPRKKELEKCKPYLLEQIKAIKPKVIVLLGNIALKTLLDKNNITKIHGRGIKKDGIIFIPTFHPAAALRFKKIKRLIEKDFLKIVIYIFKHNKP